MGKKRGSYLPTVQQARIKAKYVMGKSIRQIAEEEMRTQMTVARVVKSQDVQEFVAQIKEEYMGMAREAIQSVRVALKLEEDGKMGHQLLEDIGVAPSGKKFILATPEPQPIDGEIVVDTEAARVQKWASRLAAVAYERAKVYGTQLPEIELTATEVKKEEK